MAEPWRTAKQIADGLGVPLDRVAWALRFTGMDRVSSANARGDGDEREYSPGVQAIVVREIRSRAATRKSRGDDGPGGEP